MDKLLNSLIIRVKIHVIVRKIIPIAWLLAILYLAFYYYMNRESVDDEMFLTCCQIVFYLFIVLELANTIYKYVLINDLLKDVKELCEDDYKFKEGMCNDYKKLIDDLISREHDENLGIEERRTIERLKSGDAHLALEYLRARVEYTIAHMRLRKIEVLKKAIKKWW